MTKFGELIDGNHPVLTCIYLENRVEIRKSLKKPLKLLRRRENYSN